MAREDYQYVLDFFGEDSRSAGPVAITPDWGPALEWVHFQGVRQGRLPPVTAVGAGAVEPVWHTKLGEPYLSGVRIGIPPGDGGDAQSVSYQFPTSYLARQAHLASGELVERGSLKAGEVFRYRVSAFPRSAGAAPIPQTTDFSVVEEAQPLCLADTPLASYLGQSSPTRPDDPPADVPVFVPQHVLDEATSLANAARDVETGGILVGRLHRDRHIPDVFVEVTAQIAAPHTQSESTRLTFTAETWAAVRAALALRKRHELMLGWWHYHPDFCRLRGCPPETRRVCTASSAFFSAEDVQLHHVVFGRAYQVALLVSDSTADGLTSSLYGWRHGVVSERGFHVLHPTAAQ